MKDSTDGYESPLFGDQSIGGIREFKEGYPCIIREYDEAGDVVNEYMTRYLADDLPDGGSRYATTVNFVKWTEVGRRALVSLGYDEQGNFTGTFEVEISPSKMALFVIRDGTYFEQAPTGWFSYEAGDNVQLIFESLSSDELAALIDNPGQAGLPRIVGMVRTGDPR